MITSVANLIIAFAVLAAPSINIDVRTRESSPGSVEITPCIENAGENAVFSYAIEVRKDGASRSRTSQKGTVRVETGEKKCDFARSTVSVGEGQSVEIVFRVYQQGSLAGEKVISYPSR